MPSPLRSKAPLRPASSKHMDTTGTSPTRASAATFVHELDLDEFIQSYNKIFGTSYDSVSVAGGSASFEVQAEKKSA